MVLTHRIITYICVLISSLLTGCSQINSTNSQLLMQDAKVYCDIHEPQHWEDISPNISIDKFNEISYERVSKPLKTEAFQKFLKEMESVEFYRQMYPIAKSKIKEITGKTWDCPAYEKFYIIEINKNNTGGHTNQPVIIITKGGEYLFKNKHVNLTEESLKAALKHYETPISKLIVKLEKGASDSLLAPLFRALIPLGIENISVLNDQ